MTQHPALSNFVSKLQRNPKTDLQSLLQLKKEVILDDAQARSFLVGLTQKVSLIQGPPGTGQSYIGALLAKAIHKFTSHTILVVCSTSSLKTSLTSVYQKATCCD